MIRSTYRSSTGAVTQNLTKEQLRAALTDEGGTLWIDVVHVPQTVERISAQLRELFAFHPLAFDDAFQETHVPRVDDWDEYLYIVLHALDLELNRTLDAHELDLFLGRNYLLTIHEEPIRAIDHVWEQCGRGAEHRLASGPDHLFYSVLDTIVADYMPVVDELDDEIDEVEAEIFHRPTPRTISRIFRLRRTLLRLRRILGAMREVTNKLARDDYAAIDPRDRVYFRDVYDHLVRLYDIIEGLRDMAAGALDSYMSVTSNRINQVMRTLTTVTVLFLPISFLAGFFGMNFFGEAFNVANPTSGTALFWLCLAAMVVIPLSMYWWMRRQGWLRPVVAEDEAPEGEEKEDKELT
jgi:magnesium transporter